MTTLLVSPDFASHYASLGVLGAEAARRGERVVVATGPALRGRVSSPTASSTPSWCSAAAATAGSRASRTSRRRSAASCARSTRRRAEGMTATLAHQVRGRETDMLWQPRGRRAPARADPRRRPPAPRSSSTTSRSGPRWRCGRSAGRFASLLPSHPCQLPAPRRPRRLPGPRFPHELAPPAAELAALRELCERRARRFTAAYNGALLAIDPSADAGPRRGLGTPAPELTVVAYPAELAPDFERPGVALVGSLVRAEEADDQLAAALRRRRPGRPTVYVSLGTFLSAREDALATIAAALRRLDADAVISTGVADPSALGPLPPSWHVRAQLPQVAAIAACDAVICHGGNNTVMEALTAGVPVLAGPFSSDQFVAAEDLRRGGVGDAFAPNEAGERGARRPDRATARRAGARPCRRAGHAAAGAPGSRPRLGPDRPTGGAPAGGLDRASSGAAGSPSTAPPITALRWPVDSYVHRA